MPIDLPFARRCLAELIGTGLLVFFGAGVATVSFGFRAFGTSVSAGILLTGLVFGLVLLGLVAVISPISSCHVNPAVTLGAFLAKRIPLADLIGYWVAQMLGGLLGALLLLWVMDSSPDYSTSRIGLGANGYGAASLLHSSGGGAFLTEVILTAVFVLVVLAATRKDASAPVAGIVVGLTLALVNIMGIPIDGASVNPARSFGPAIIVGGQALSQLWLFLIAPLVGGVIGVGVYLLFHPVGDDAVTARAGDTDEGTATLRPAAGGENAPAATDHAAPFTTDKPTGSADPPDEDQ
ncbi:MAG TPA: aquaporin [Streptosporangiaceae bacterium]|jgi:aquaporin Z